MQKKKQITEQEVKDAMPGLYPLLITGRLAEMERVVQAAMDDLGLDKADRANIRNAYDAISPVVENYNERVKEMSSFFGGDMHAAGKYCFLDDLRSAATAIAMSRAEDINGRNHYMLPFKPLQRQWQKHDDIAFLRDQIKEDLTTLGGMREWEAKTTLQSFERALNGALNGLAGQGAAK